jgi:asparagine synthase (glutamine-hydrolysing)
MSRRMSSRGPDAEGIWNGQDIVLGHRRLAILDLDERSNQPMFSPDRRYAIVFNGEIYNFRELREELQAQGEILHTTSDTEVLIALYARQGEAMLPRLRGMFAFAIWDGENRELFLARDPYGIKPLYYARTAKGFVFASQVKALLASGLVAGEIEPAGLAGFYLWGNVPEPWTLYKGVSALTAGSWMRVKGGEARSLVRWCNISESWNHEQMRYSADELQERVRNAVTESVRAHLVSDVPVSVFLSGGIDSGAIIGLISQLGAKVEGFTVGFEEFKKTNEDEVPAAAAIAAHYGFGHHVRHVTRAEFDQDLPLFIDAMDQPTVDGMNTWFASKAVAEHGYKVVLSGVGGDELFYGYLLSKEIPRDARRRGLVAAIPGARALLTKFVEALPSKRLHPKLHGLADYMGTLQGEYFLRRGLFLPQELPQLMDPEQAREGLERLGGTVAGIPRAEAVNPQGTVCMLDSILYLRNQLLRDSDWASMAHSLELRTPLVDAALLTALQPLHTHFKNGMGKRLLAKSPLNGLPEDVIHRPKTGFAVPMTQWLADAAGRQSWKHSALLSPPGTPWTRRWATMVVASFLEPPRSVWLKSEAC